MGIFHSILIFAIPVFSLDGAPDQNGRGFDLSNLMVVAFITVVNCHYLMLFIYARHYNMITVGFYILSFALYCPFGLWLADASDASFVYVRLSETVFSSYHFFIVTIIITASIILPIYFYLTFKRLIFPSLKHLIQQNMIDLEAIKHKLDPV